MSSIPGSVGLLLGYIFHVLGAYTITRVLSWLLHYITLFHNAAYTLSGQGASTKSYSSFIGELKQVSFQFFVNISVH